MWPLALAAWLLLVGQAYASLSRDLVYEARRDDVTQRSMRKRAMSTWEGDLLNRRATVSGSITGINSAQLERQILASCSSTLSGIPANQADSSGMAVCYNVPTLDNQTGVFQADMRLYRIADATGNFAGLTADAVQVALQYNGAAVQPINASSSFVFKRDVSSLISWSSTRPKRSLESRASLATPKLTQSYAFVGQVNMAMVTPGMTDAQMQALVLPSVSLTAMSTANKPAFASILNSTQASFLVGAFSKNAAMTTGPSATSTVSQPSSTVFVLPGTKILIFPIGAIITGLWVILGFSTIMYGTLGRIQFRDQYRRQSARANTANVSRI